MERLGFCVVQGECELPNPAFIMSLTRGCCGDWGSHTAPSVPSERETNRTSRG